VVRYGAYRASNSRAILSAAFVGETAVDTERQVIADDPIPPSRLNAKVALQFVYEKTCNAGPLRVPVRQKARPPSAPQHDTVEPGTAGASCHSTISFGGSRDVSIHRRQRDPPRAVERGIDGNDASGPAIILAIKEQQLHARGVSGVDAEVGSARTDGGAKRRALAGLGSSIHRASCSFAAATTRSGSKPNLVWSSLSGAEAPNVFMPMTRPVGPT
jgi:hypothetical protein